MRPSTTALRYAQAAFEVAQSEGKAEEWVRALQSANETLSEQRLALFFRDPNVSSESKLEAIKELFADAFEPQIVNLLRLLAVKQRLVLLPGITNELEDLVREAQGVLKATAVVARQLDANEQADIIRRLEQITGKRIDLRVSVDPSILGGIVVRIGDRLIDASVANRLQRLRQELAV